jgi:hypothetical protein
MMVVYNYRRLPHRIISLLIIVVSALVLPQLVGCKNAVKEQATIKTLSADQRNKLFTDNFSPFLHDMEDPTIQGDSATALDQFNIEYWTGHYPEAINRYLSLDSEQQQKQGLKFRYANALLANERFDESRIVFQDIADHGPSLHANESRWYLALIEIHDGNIGKARDLLKAYRNSMNPLLGRQSDNLLRELSND